VTNDRTDGSARRPREEVAGVLLDGRALAAEVATDVAAVDDHLVRREVHHFGNVVPQRKRSLERGHDLDALVVVDPDDAAVGLDVALVLARTEVDILDDEVRLGKELVDLVRAL